MWVSNRQVFDVPGRPANAQASWKSKSFLTFEVKSVWGGSQRFLCLTSVISCLKKNNFGVFINLIKNAEKYNFVDFFVPLFCIIIFFCKCIKVACPYLTMIGFEDLIQILSDGFDFFQAEPFKSMIQMQTRQVQKRISFHLQFGSQHACLFAQSTKLH